MSRCPRHSFRGDTSFTLIYLLRSLLSPKQSYKHHTSVVVFRGLDIHQHTGMSNIIICSKSQNGSSAKTIPTMVLGIRGCSPHCCTVAWKKPMQKMLKICLFVFVLASPRRRSTQCGFSRSNSNVEHQIKSPHRQTTYAPAATPQTPTPRNAAKTGLSCGLRLCGKPGGSSMLISSKWVERVEDGLMCRIGLEVMRS